MKIFHESNITIPYHEAGQKGKERPGLLLFVNFDAREEGDIPGVREGLVAPLREASVADYVFQRGLITLK